MAGNGEPLEYLGLASKSLFLNGEPGEYLGLTANKRFWKGEPGEKRGFMGLPLEVLPNERDLAGVNFPDEVAGVVDFPFFWKSLRPLLSLLTVFSLCSVSSNSCAVKSVDADKRKATPKNMVTFSFNSS